MDHDDYDVARLLAATAPGAEPSPPSGRRRKAPVRRLTGWKRAWPFAAGLGAVCVAVVTLSNVAVHGTERTYSLSVAITDAVSRSSDECAPDDYAGTFFDGATVTVEDAAGVVVASATLGPPTLVLERGCSWAMSFDEVPESAAYTVRVTSAGTPPREYSFDYSPDRLDDLDWSIWVGVIA